MILFLFFQKSTLCCANLFSYTFRIQDTIMNILKINRGQFLYKIIGLF
jgi:hypothetical protein